MIADWTVDAGMESPWIVVPWDGWMDLHSGIRTETADAADRVRELSEVQAFPEVGKLLAAANMAGMVSIKVI